MTNWRPPGRLPWARQFAKAETLVLGLPLKMAWIAGWIAGRVIVLTALDRVEKRYRTDEGGDA